MIGGACSIHGRDKKCIKSFGQNLKGRDHLGDIGIYGRIMLEWVLQCVNWINVPNHLIVKIWTLMQYFNSTCVKI
jgi:hypothetical protein